jgi:hypothetical protein
MEFRTAKWGLGNFRHYFIIIIIIIIIKIITDSERIK